MTHYEYGLTWGEFGGSERVTCYDCGREGSGLVSEGWDSIELDDGEIESVCGCDNLFDTDDGEAKENKRNCE